MLKLLILITVTIAASVVTFHLVDRIAWSLNISDRAHETVVYSTSLSVLVLTFWYMTTLLS